tara:strand:- start:452 stop:1405 length:954 start_codon:yes stop_codon:yes gene_type:complete
MAGPDKRRKSTGKGPSLPNDKNAPLDASYKPNPDRVPFKDEVAENLVPPTPPPVAVPSQLDGGMIRESISQSGAPHYTVEWEGRELFVGFPCYKTTNPVTAWCLLAIALDLGKEKVRFDMELGDAMIYHARNRLAEKFLATDAKWMLMIDDDTIPPIGRPEFFKTMCRLPADYPHESASRHVVHRLIGHQKTLVGGCYFGRQPGGALMAAVAVDPAVRRSVLLHEDRLVESDWVGTGCLLIHRTVFEAIRIKFPELAPRTTGQPFNFFQPMQDGAGEDIAFCMRANAAGHRPHLDLGLQCAHVGYACYASHTSGVGG